MGVGAVVLGGSGFSGGEVVRLLEGHPHISVVAVSGDRSTGSKLGSVQPHLRSYADLDLLTFEDALEHGSDVIFSCLPSGRLAETALPESTCVVDISDDHRNDPGWVYGLTEFARTDLTGSTRIANPGCYPTATLMALVPFVRAGLIGGPIVVDAMSGVTGAGRSTRDNLLLATADSNVTAYGTTEHRHVPEMERGLARFGDSDVLVSFTPHLVPMARGLLVTAKAPTTEKVSTEEALEVLRAAYADEPFVLVTEDWPSTKPVTGTNDILLSARFDPRTGFLICSAAIDNLGKGAAGQAVQNLNVALGFPETAGLEARAVWP